MNICRIDRKCDTFSKSVSIEERVWKVFGGNGVDDFFVPPFCSPIGANDTFSRSLSILKSISDTTGCLIISSRDGIFVVRVISDENSSSRLLI